jgi:hypothetical protein
MQSRQKTTTMTNQSNHVDPSISSGFSPPFQKERSLSAEELHLWADAIEKIFNEPYPAVAQPEFRGGAR